MAHSTRSKLGVQQGPPATRARRGRDSPADAAPPAEAVGGAAPARKPISSGGVGTIGGAITWLSGSVAGIAAIFYAFGYFASFAYARMLGVNLASLHYDYTFYVQRGAIFFVWLLVETAPYLFLVVGFGLLILFAVLGLRQFRHSRTLTQRLSSILGHRRNWQSIAYVALLLLLALQVSTHLRYPEALAVTDVLDSAATNNPPAGSIRELILSGSEHLLRDQFVYLANQELWIGTLLVLAWVVSRRRRWGAMHIAPFALVFVTSTVYLALEYGTLALPVTFQKASIPAEGPPTPLYLLNQIEAGYVFWDCRDRQARWVPTGTTRVVLSEKQTLRQILSSCEGAER